jgi:hypothetical protein
MSQTSIFKKYINLEEEEEEEEDDDELVVNMNRSGRPKYKNGIALGYGLDDRGFESQRGL